MAKTVGETLLDPQKAARLATTLLFVGTVFVVFVIWVFAGNAAAKIPLLILGIVSIVLILTTVEKSYLCGIAIVIIGTVVAQEDFLLKVAHMFRGPPGSVDQYLQTYGDRGASTQRDEHLKNEITQALEKILGESLPKDKRQEITDLLSQARVAEAVNRLKGRKDADFPLRKFSEGGARLEQFLKDFEKSDFFLNDLVFLRDNGFVQCTRPDDLRTCQITELGRRVIDAIDRPLLIPKSSDDILDKKASDQKETPTK